MTLYIFSRGENKLKDSPCIGGDLLNIELINSIPGPLMAMTYDGWEWEVIDIDVESGLVRINVSGMPDVKDIVEFKQFTDADGVIHDPDTFYSDYDGGEQ